MPQLPFELVLQIVDSLVDFGTIVPVALRIEDSRTRTLYTLLTVSRATHPIAKRHLYTNCLHIDSSNRLRLLLNSLSRKPRAQCSLDFRLCISRLYLAPFTWDSIDDPAVARWIFELFSIISPTLKRLVIDMALRSLDPVQDHLSVRPVLREAFSRLENLEEFTSTRDELYLDVHLTRLITEPRVWTYWPRLRKLALYNVDVNSDFAEAVKLLPNLDTLVLTRADGLLTNPIPHIFRKEEEGQELRLMVADFDKRGLEVELGARPTYTNEEGDEVLVPGYKHLKGSVQLFTFLVESHVPDDFSITYTQETVRDWAIEGLLWERSNFYDKPGGVV
jgi:hypothetical protein